MKMKKITILCLITVGLFSFNSCITMQIVSISDVKPTTGTVVNASAEGSGFLHLSAPLDLAEKATNALKNKGAVGNVSTVMTMREWGIIQYYKVIATGTTDATINGVNDPTDYPNNTITNNKVEGIKPIINNSFQIGNVVKFTYALNANVGFFKLDHIEITNGVISSIKGDILVIKFLYKGKKEVVNKNYKEVELVK